MVLDLMGIPTNLPLYDSEGNIVNEVPELNYTSQEVSSEEVEQETAAANARTIVKTALLGANTVGSNLSVDEEVNVYPHKSAEGNENDVYYGVLIHGGKNGHGLWSNYLDSLADVMLRIECECLDAWIRKIEIDVPDDVFTAEIGIYPFC